MTDVAHARTGRRGAERPATASGADLTTMAGLAGGLALVAGAILLGGALTAFLDLASVAIVIGGTIAVTIASVGAGGVTALPRALGRALARRGDDPIRAARRVIGLADIARRKGVLALQGELDRPSDPPFLRAGLRTVVDGAGPDEATQIMAAEAAAIAEHGRVAVDTLRRAAEVAPAMGLIGTLIGLVQMLGRLSDPSAIGPALAVALLTTLYGAIIANMILAPLATKLERDAEREALVNDIHRAGVASIGRTESPRRLEALINALLPPGQRVAMFD